MTDKQIIIDGVDVSGCKHIDTDCFNCEIFAEVCHEVFPNCYYKQLKRKEQECDELKKVNDEKNELLAKLGCPTKATAKRQVFTLEQQISQLKAENKELKAENDTYKSSIIANLDKCISKRYRELLEENDQLKIENEKLKKQLESTKGLVTVGNKQLMEALFELQKQQHENCNFDKIKDLVNEQ